MHEAKFKLCKSLTHDKSIPCLPLCFTDLVRTWTFYMKKTVVIEAMRSDEKLELPEKYCSMALLL